MSSFCHSNIMPGHLTSKFNFHPVIYRITSPEYPCTGVSGPRLFLSRIFACGCVTRVPTQILIRKHSKIDDKIEQDSENSSKQSSDSSSESSESAVVFSVVLRQKPRGSGGIWQPVQASEHLRVSDKRAGKNLRLVLTSHQRNIDWSSIKVHLLEKPTRITNSNFSVADVWQPREESFDFFKISGRKTFATGMESSRRSVCQIDLKLFLMYRTIKFDVTVRRPGSDEADARIHAESVTFISYNSGTEETNRQSKSSKKATTKRKRAGKKQKRTWQSHSAGDCVCPGLVFFFPRRYRLTRYNVFCPECSQSGKVVPCQQRAKGFRCQSTEG
jgi:hypothetical protein